MGVLLPECRWLMVWERWKDLFTGFELEGQRGCLGLFLAKSLRLSLVPCIFKSILAVFDRSPLSG